MRLWSLHWEKAVLTPSDLSLLPRLFVPRHCSHASCKLLCPSTHKTSQRHKDGVFFLQEKPFPKSPAEIHLTWFPRWRFDTEHHSWKDRKIWPKIETPKFLLDCLWKWVSLDHRLHSGYWGTNTPDTLHKGRIYVPRGAEQDPTRPPRAT